MFTLIRLVVNRQQPLSDNAKLPFTMTKVAISTTRADESTYVNIRIYISVNIVSKRA